MSSADLVSFTVRCVLVLLFLPFSALDKVLGFQHAVGQAREIFKAHRLAVLVVLCGIGIEVPMPLGIVSGIADRACALVMASYCAVTAVLFKRFWAQGDFRSDPNGRGRTLFWDFLKNFALGAGFLLITIGPDGTGLHAFLDQPFASSHPYGSEILP